MKNTPLVTVIMPLYNKRPYVGRAVESVQNQTFTNWELIIVDDGSTDGSASEIPTNEPNISLIRIPNSGPAAARNKGVESARGELIAFLDADDYFYPDKLAWEVRLIYEENLAEWMVSCCEHETGDQVRLKVVRDGNGTEVKETPKVFEDALRQIKIQGWPASGLFTRKSLLHRAGGFNESMRCFEITELMIRLALEQPCLLVYPRPLFRVVDVPGSAFKVSSHRIDGIKQLAESLYQLLDRYPAFSDVLMRQSRQKQIAHIKKLISVHRKKEARKCLSDDFPYAHDREWLKLWILSRVPGQFLEYYRNKREISEPNA